jgi:nicotinamide-nucleotide amidase
MNACIVSIGNELLNGHTADTNTPWLCAKLLEVGIPVKGGWLVPDEHDRIIQSLRQAAEWGSLILVTGGLGPTDDDITRQTVADYLQVSLEFHPELLEKLKSFFAQRGRPMPEKNISQAYIPLGCEIVDNPKGTAAGFWSDNGQVKIAVMPGVPEEMKFMFETQILPRLNQLPPDTVVVNDKVRCFGIGESDIAQKLGNLMQRGRNPLINSTCGSGDVVLHISATACNRDEALQMIKQDKQLLSELLGDCIYGYEDESLAHKVGGLLRQRSKTLAVAESCTGGLLSEMLTDIPGSSDYLLAGWIAYSNEAKINQLGVPEQLIIEHGAVSGPVAREMAIGAVRKSGADIAIGITGIAGPGGGSIQKPIGLVFISLYLDGECTVYEYRFPPVSRQSIRQRAAMTALNLIRKQL